MSYETVNPARARQLLDSNEGWVYLDVRSVDEFEAGHPEGAFNAPLAHRSPMGMEPNPDFAAAVARNFSADAKLVVGCAMGGRSASACEVLASQGFANLVNMHGGFSGARDQTGRVTEAGWQECGFPIGTNAPDERTWRHLSKR
jgi:rhodanese-related sulfurtransferase